jgi:hypothetical protein
MLSVKKVFFVLVFIFPFNWAFSQNHNLEFNQVYSYAGFLNGGANSPVWTVPASKVWKVDFFTTDWLVLNGNKASNLNNNGGPLWLKEGDVVYYSGPSYSICCGGTTNYLISIIEFNVVP